MKSAPHPLSAARRALLLLSLTGGLATLLLAVVCSVWTSAGCGFTLGRADVFLIAHGGGIVEIGLDHDPGSSTRMGPSGLEFYDRFETAAQAAEAWTACLSLPRGNRFIQYYWIEVPLWLPLLLFTVTVLLASRTGRPRGGANACGSCGYDLTGNVTGRCPECGASAVA